MRTEIFSLKLTIMLSLIERLFNPKSNAPEITHLFLHALNVKISRPTLTTALEDHPDYPSLLSISDVLKKHKVENLVARFSSDKLHRIEVPFITQIKVSKTGVDYFTVVSGVSNGIIKYYDPERHRLAVCNTDEFTEKWSGIVLLAEPEEGAGERDYSRNVLAEKRKRLGRAVAFGGVPLITMIAVIIAFIQTGFASILPILFSLLTLAGTIIAVLLIYYELDQYNPGLREICGSGKKVNCGAVLHSKASKIWGISWSSIGVIYYTGGLLVLLTLGITSGVALFIVSWLNIAALPYVFFSIYYQWKVVKQWCTFCLLVQCFLVLQFVTSLVGGLHFGSSFRVLLSGAVLVPVLLSYLFPFIVLQLLLPLYQRLKEVQKNGVELKKLKRDYRIFNALLEKQKVIPEPPGDLGITLGNPNANFRIVKVCNPYCGPCARAHDPIEELLGNPDVQVQIIFAASTAENDSRAAPVKHFMAIAEDRNESVIKRALHDWYSASIKDYEVFASKYPIGSRLMQQGDKIEAMHKWCLKTQISFTPTIFLNGHQLPDTYAVNELKYLLSN